MTLLRVPKLQSARRVSWSQAAPIMAAVAVLGVVAVLLTFAASVPVAFEPESGVLTGPVVLATPAGASGSGGVQFGGSGASTPTPTPTPTASPTPSPTPVPGGIPAAGSYVQPGTVGYLGSAGALTQYPHGGAAPAGCAWQSYGLRCDNTNVTLDHVHVLGGIYFTGTGNLTITNSIIEGGDAWYVIYDAAVTPSAGAKITVTDSTLKWEAGLTEPNGQDISPVWTRGDQPEIMTRNDISGTPQGVDPPGGSIIQSNWIHDLSQPGCGSGVCHIDGIFSQGGDNVLVQQNYIDAPVRTDVTAGLFWQNLGATNTGGKAYANFIRGGAYYDLVNQTMVGLDVRNNTFGGTANTSLVAPGTIGVWSGNIRPGGSVVPAP